MCAVNFGQVKYDYCHAYTMDEFTKLNKVQHREDIGVNMMQMPGRRLFLLQEEVLQTCWNKVYDPIENDLLQDVSQNCYLYMS